MLFPSILIWILLRISVATEDIKEGDGYSFHYQVDSQSDNVHFSHNEDRHGYLTIGSYKTLLPDGRTQVVEYTVLDKDSGYVAKVSYQGVATEGKPQYGQQRLKGIKREIPAGSYAQAVKIKPYGRNIEHHKLPESNIYTTTIPTAIENVTVIPSPEIVTIATKYDLELGTSSQEQQQEDATTGDIKNIEYNHGIHSNITGLIDPSSIKSNYAHSTETSTTASVVPGTTEPVKEFPLPEIVTQATEPKVNEEKFDFSLAPVSEHIRLLKENVQSIPKETKIVPPNVIKLTEIKIPLREETKKNKNVQDGTNTIKLFVVPDTANVSTKNHKIYGIIDNSKKEHPIYEYNFKPIQDKTTLTKARDTFDTKNKALYQTNFSPKSHHPYTLQKPVNNYYRKPKYASPQKKHEKHYFPFHFPLVTHTRRHDGFSPPKKVNVIKIKKSLQIPILRFKDWFPFKL